VMERWKSPGGRPIHELQLPPFVKGQLPRVAFDAKNARAALACLDRKVVVLNLCGEPARLDLDEPERPLAVLAFSGDGRRLAGADDDRSIYVWDSAIGKLEASFTTQPGKTPFGQIAFDKDGQRLAVVADDGTIQVWDWQKQTAIVSLKES